jgi:outer membrane protein OmpA-like peptidoglycan-associated protein
MQARRTRRSAILVSVLVMGLGLSSRVFAQGSSNQGPSSDDFRAVITEHKPDGTLTVQADDGSIVVVTMTDATKVRSSDGMRVRKMSSSVLVPGLRVKVHGEYTTGNQYAADRITFTREDLKTARAIQGGLVPTDQQVAANAKRIDENAQMIAQQQATLGRQAQQLANNRAQIAANEQKIVATAGRIDNLNDYNVLGSVTVFFPNNKYTIAPKYRAQLEQLASQAKGTTSYMIQVQGFASAVGPYALNQRLSMQRADAVTSVLQQNGVPLPNVVVPAAMGITEQVASNKTAKGQAENRRAVVTLLQSKGIANK